MFKVATDALRATAVSFAAGVTAPTSVAENSLRVVAANTLAFTGVAPQNVLYRTNGGQIGVNANASAAAVNPQGLTVMGGAVLTRRRLRT